MEPSGILFEAPHFGPEDEGFDLAAALLRLAADESGVRSPGVTDAERAFNLIAERLDAARDGGGEAGASMLSPTLFEAEPGPVYVASMALRGVNRLRRQLGAAIADDILQRTVARLRAAMPRAKVGRVGRSSVEFAFVAPDTPSATTMLTRLEGALDQRLDVDGQTFDLEVVIGFACRDAQEEHVADCAAEALIEAQAQGLKVRFYHEPDRQRALESSALLRDLRAAIANDGLSLVYQPKLHVETREVRAVEALLRWRHPTRGAVSPDSFVTLAEETGLIGDLTRWVLKRAMADQAWLAGSGRPVLVYVNLSGRLVPDETFCQWILATLGGDGGHRIGLEITETAVIDDPQRALANLKALADAGVKIAIDDYGSGLSSLSYLKQMPAHELKIDKLFISGLTSSHRDPLLVRSTIEVAHALGMEVTAEGVESNIVLSLLGFMGCDYVQGYLVSKPLDIDALKNFLGGAENQIDANLKKVPSKISFDS